MKLIETNDVTITTVVDNHSDALLKATEGVERYGANRDPLLAEHGLSMHIRFAAVGREILLDTGFTKLALPHNLSRLEIDSANVDQVVISHGHRDHTTGLTEFLRMARKTIPVVVHPDAFLERWFLYADGSRLGPWLEDAQEWEQAGAQIVCVEEPYELLPGCLATGPVPRRTDFEKGTAHRYYRKAGEMIHDPVNDDQSIVVNVKGKGLVIISGCAHAGIVNSVLYAQEITGVREVYAVIGGFHLLDASAKVERTIAELKRIGPTLVVPAHCTGFLALRRLAVEMPNEFVLNAVGTKLLF